MLSAILKYHLFGVVQGFKTTTKFLFLDFI